MEIYTNFTLSCGLCGAPLHEGNGNKYHCAYCGYDSYITNPAMQYFMIAANSARESALFDMASSTYKNILDNHAGDDVSDVYWNLFLCQQNVIFETDEKGERFPSFYRIVSESAEDSPYYEKAVSCAKSFGAERKITFYESMKEKVVRAKNLYSRIKESEKPYDIFVCFKKSDDNGIPTPDTQIGMDIYNEFSRDYRVFFSERSLRDTAVRDYEPNIYYALYSAKVMLLICSKKEYLESQWVKNEWARYNSFARYPATQKTIIPIFTDEFSPDDLPSDLMGYQGMKDDRHLFDSLKETLGKIFVSKTEKFPVSAEDVSVHIAEEILVSAEEEISPPIQSSPDIEQTDFEAEPTDTNEPEEEAYDASYIQNDESDDDEYYDDDEYFEDDECNEISDESAFTISENILFKYIGENSGRVIIPYGVTEIYDSAFKGFDGISEVIIPVSVTSIGESAFQNCSKLENITIPSSINTIGNFAFRDCHSLANISIEEGVTSIGESAFQNCSKLESITIPSSINIMGKSAFQECDSLTNVSIKEGASSIGYYAFAFCSKLENITIPSSIKTIQNYAFKCCYSLTNVSIEEGASSIGDYAFCFCTKLENITIPSSIKTIHNFAFQDCHSLANVSIKEGVSSIGLGAFWNCSSLHSISIPDSVETIGIGAFCKCSSLVSITIPPKITKIDVVTFSRCSSLIKVKLPEGLKSIEPQAFFMCSNLERLNIPSTISYISDAAFLKCEKFQLPAHLSSKLTPLTLDDEVFKIEDGKLISYSGNFAEVYIPEGVTSIGKNAFVNCSNIETIKLPCSIKAIDDEAFGYGQYSVNADSVECWCDIDFPDWSSNPLKRGNGKLYWFIPLDSVSTLVTELTIPNTVKAIKDRAFYGCKSITSVIIPSSVTSIGSFAFSCCSNLTSITIPDSVTSIGSFAFSYCSNLKTIHISNEIKNHACQVFEDCKNIRDVYIHNKNPLDCEKIVKSVKKNCDFFVRGKINFHIVQD